MHRLRRNRTVQGELEDGVRAMNIETVKPEYRELILKAATEVVDLRGANLSGTNLSGTNSVSYTHLDVYKRQEGGVP